MRPPLHTLHPLTDYIGTVPEAAADRLGIAPGRYVYRPVSIYFAEVLDGAQHVGVVEIGTNGLLPDNPPTRLE